MGVIRPSEQSCNHLWNYWWQTWVFRFNPSSKLRTVWVMGDYVLVKAGLGEGRLLRICPNSEQSFVILFLRGRRLADGKIYHYGLHCGQTSHFEPSTETSASSLLV